ncbi:MAG: bifunctional methylenetetrahydrofolate dehydrogenase/methenyltetrahydrofolate cyclohydrolase FolD [Calditrichaceae bacterium]|nr:bifunctional methylenetetrahydrofolate dehydrogenase/methenyltetrahydrofolate cyclohydrolase FolD [Calditrichia bacterium]NUQ42448.1 bifunctional methylenetetrahydrofolate dehydrogenase/methenyltetrahydrofolate cyclohydrolase FolD [Calditrichaceae bacterium]
MKAQIIDGKSIAARVREEVREEVAALEPRDRPPGLAVILVGDDPASQVYVRSKGKACEEAGIHSITETLPASVSESQLLERIAQLNRDETFHGILVQLPLPKHINTETIIESITPEKDVDCFHPFNVGRLAMGAPIFEPATPAGIMELLKRQNISPVGKHAVIVGRSNIVGKPLANLLMQKHPHANAVVTVAHSAVGDISRFTRQADILVAAIGQPELIRGDMVKEGAVVIDVGVNRVEAPNPKGYRLVGDVAFEEAAEKAGYITPVPGGVGPMTIAMLLKNTMKAYRLQMG